MDVMPNVIIEDYKTLEVASDEEKEAMSNYICDRLGFTKSVPLLTDEQWKSLEANGWV